MRTYTITNMLTGEIREGLKAKTVSDILGIDTHNISCYAKQNCLYNKIYKIEAKDEDNIYIDMPTNFPRPLLKEWDEVTSKFRRYYNGRLQENS
jgi:hypothetical protein